ncbi:MAG: ABC-type transport system involved in cytochrome c biogenesis permease subunit, partial [Glaciecola sp.]
MSTEQWADLSQVLFSPTTFLLYFSAMLASFYSLAFTRVARDGDDAGQSRAGLRAGHLATVLTSVGLLTHLGHIVARSAASGWRVPWGNMFEFSSVIGFIVVATGLFIVQWRMKRPEILGFMLFSGLMSMAAAYVLFTAPGPLQPILNSDWLKIHVFAIMLGFAIFVVGFTFNALYLLREIAERRVAASIAAVGDHRSIGAKYAGDTIVENTDGDSVEGHEQIDTR